MTDDAKLLAEIDGWAERSMGHENYAEAIRLVFAARNRIAALERQMPYSEELAVAMRVIADQKRQLAEARSLLLRWLQFYNLSVAGTATVADMDALRKESHAAIDPAPLVTTTPQDVAAAVANIRSAQRPSRLPCGHLDISHHGEKCAVCYGIGDDVGDALRYVRSLRNGVPLAFGQAEHIERTLEALAEARPIPREPTEAMLRAVIDGKFDGGNAIGWMWRAMYDAAIAQPEGEKK